MEVRTERKAWNSHPQVETDWGKSLLEKHTHLTTKQIIELKLDKEYELKFGKSKTAVSLYSWLDRIANPEKFKEWAKSSKQNKKSGNSNSRLLPKDKANLEKADYLLYVEDRVLGFDSIDMVKTFIKDNTIISGDVKIFKKVPIKINYNVEIGV